jgi:hypothetical protein
MTSRFPDLRIDDPSRTVWDRGGFAGAVEAWVTTV